jgi:hypothetical protein
MASARCTGSRPSNSTVQASSFRDLRQRATWPCLASGEALADFRRGHRRALPIRDALLIGGAAHRVTPAGGIGNGHSHRRELQSGLEDELAARRLNAESSTRLLPQLTSAQRGAGIGPIRRRHSAGWARRGLPTVVAATLVLSASHISVSPSVPWVHAPNEFRTAGEPNTRHLSRGRTRAWPVSGGGVQRSGVGSRGRLMGCWSRPRRLSGCCWELRQPCGAVRAVRCQGCGRARRARRQPC